MRTFVLFALALTGTAILTDDASAIGRRKRGGSSGSCGAPAAQAAPCCGGGAAAVGGYPGGVVGAAPGMTVNGQQTMIQTTDGQVYTLGADGRYYSANAGVNTLGGFANQPYGGTSRSFYGPGGYPAGGTPPRTMPGVIPPGGTTIVPTPMLPK